MFNSIILKFIRCCVAISLFLLSGCGPNIVSVQPSGTIDKEYQAVGMGRNVHIFPCTKGPAVKEITPGVFNLDPTYERRKSSEFQTTSNLPDVVTQTTALGLTQAGFAVTTGKIVPQSVDITIGCELAYAAILIGGTDWENAVQLADAARVLLSGTGFVSSGYDPRGGLAVDLTFDRINGAKIKKNIVSIEKSTMHLTSSQGNERAFRFALESYQQKAAVETLKVLGFRAP